MGTDVPLSFLTPGIAFETPMAIMLVTLGFCLAILASQFAYTLAAIKNIRTQHPASSKGLVGLLVVLLLGAICSLYFGIHVSGLLMLEPGTVVLTTEVTAMLALAEIGNALWPPLLATVLGVVFGSLAKMGGDVSARPVQYAGSILSTLSSGKLSIAEQGFSQANGSEEADFEITMASGDEVEAEEREYIENILELGDTTAQEVMCPRTDVVSVDVDMESDEILKIVADSRHSRFPVYEGSIDHVLGVLHLRDLFEHLSKGEGVENLDIRSIIHDCISIPESRKIDDAIKDIQRHQGHLAVVMDEFGGTAGILTIEDLLEEIVGEIQDEHDDEAKQIHEMEDGIKIISGQMPIDDLNELLKTEFEEEDVDTLGGLVTAHLGHIPIAQESLNIDNIKLTVLSVEKNRVGQVRVDTSSS